jgi:hypothetical protein
LQLVFPEIWRATDRPKKLSEQEATVAATNYTDPSRRECLEQTAAVAADNCADHDAGKQHEQAAYNEDNSIS